MPSRTSSSRSKASRRGGAPVDAVAIKVDAVATKPAAEGQPITTFARAVRFLDSLHNFERRRIVTYTPENFNLGRMRELCDRLDDPQAKYASVHVAGTKGKGSTCAMIAAVLRAAGLTVGLYSSPHLVDVRERLRVLRPEQDATALPQGQMISREKFARLAKQAEPIVAELKIRPTYFDVLTAIAFRHFADEKVDIAVVETGLGGRLDSTNVLEPLVTVITPVSLDHVEQLGPTLAKIAGEKAGIFKPGATAVTAPQDETVLPVLRAAAKNVGQELRVLGEEIEFTWRFEASRMLGRHNRVTFETPRTSLDHLAAPLLGEHQAINCGLALAAIDDLKARGWAVTDDDVRRGLAKLTLEGRMEVVRCEPTVIVDCAHNPASIDALLKGVGQHFDYDACHVIFGCCNDKDAAEMLARLASGADKTIFTRVDSVRSADPRELQRIYQEKFGRMSHAVDSLDEALKHARRSIGTDDLLLITGSFYLVGTAKKLLAKRAAAR